MVHTENLADTFELQFLVIGKYTLLWAVLRIKPPMSKRKAKHKFPGGYSFLPMDINNSLE